MYYVYMLHNSVTGKYYIGYSSDLKKRFQEHISWKNTSTCNHCADWKLVYYEAYMTEKSARSRERQLKAHGKWVAVIKARIQTDTGE